MARRSSTLRNGPPFCLNEMIAPAIAGPTPGNCSSSADVAEFRSRATLGGFFLPPAETPLKTIRKMRQSEIENDLRLTVLAVEHVARAGTRQDKRSRPIPSGRCRPGLVRCAWLPQPKAGNRSEIEQKRTSTALAFVVHGLATDRLALQTFPRLSPRP